MEKSFLEECLAEERSLDAIGELVGKHPSTVGYWLKKHGLKASHAERHAPKGSVKRLEAETERSVRKQASDAAREAGIRKVYLRCSRHGHTAFFQRSDGGFRCLKCNVAAVSERRRQVKRRLAQEAGGCCRICGFKEHQAALQLHHRDPSQKLFHLSDKGVTRGIGRMRVEARKCVLLCANCHALVEAGVKEVPVEDR